VKFFLWWEIDVSTTFVGNIVLVLQSYNALNQIIISVFFLSNGMILFMGWVGPRACLNAVAKKKVSAPVGDRTRAVQPFH
jgi:hypothetical protein